MINRIKQLVVGSAVAFFLIGCNDSVDTNLRTTQTIKLTPGVDTLIYPGDKLLPVDAATVVKVRHDVEGTLKYVSVLKGSVTLVRGNYIVKE